MAQKTQRSVTKQILLGLMTNFSSLAPSMSLGFSAVTLPYLREILDSNQITWFASSASLATPFGSLFAGPIADKFGRRSALFLVNISTFIGWLLIGAAYYVDQKFIMLLIGRMFTGFSTGLASMPSSCYMAEVSSTKLRGTFTTWGSISFALGILIIYLLGYILTQFWGTMAFITALFPVIGMAFIFFFIPESPSWLVTKKRLEEAKKNMCKIFGVKEYEGEVRTELESLVQLKTKTCSNKGGGGLRKLIRDFKKPSCWKPLLIMTAYFFFQQFSGTFVVVFYAIDIVKEANISLDAYVTIVLVAAVRFAASVGVSFISKKWGRRPLSVISGIGLSLSIILLATYVLLVKKEVIAAESLNTLSFIPLILLLLYFAFATLGFFILPFAMSAEVFAPNIRCTASGICSGLGYFFNFLTVKFYPSMVTSMTSQGVFFFYGVMGFIGTIFVFFFLPETKGKTQQEIHDYFEPHLLSKRPSESDLNPDSLKV